MDKRGTTQWYWKYRAIIQAARALQRAIPDEWLAQSTFVPIPTSKARDYPLYDDRMTQVLLRINPPLDVRELILQSESTEATHDRADRPRPADISSLYSIDDALRNPSLSAIILCDDVLTTGAHYKAVQAVIGAAFPNVPVSGVFIARRVPETIDFSCIFDKDPL